MEVQQRHGTATARLQELEDERLRRLSESAALQEAALERRRVQESERVARIQKDEERRRELEAKAEQARRQEIERRKETTSERMRRAELKREEREAESAEKRRELTEKLEKVTKRHEEYVVTVKEKAAAQNRQAEEVVSRVTAVRTPDKPHLFCLQCNLEVSRSAREDWSLGLGSKCSFIHCKLAQR